jgi:tRNA(Arg) A34 adenosine deaminase TadA
MLALLNKAVQLAKDNSDDKSFHMACVAKRADGAIVSSVNHCVHGQPIPQHHAEARALRKCDYGSVLYVARVLKDKTTWGNAKPCKKCQALIKNMGVKRVYYTVGPNEWGTWIP